MTKPIETNQYDEFIQSVDWLQDATLPIAITFTELLEPSEGQDAIIFPPTFAHDKRKSEHPYQIDVLDEKQTPQEAQTAHREANNCLIDSIGSQANRMESVFKQSPLSALVPQITISLKSSDAKKTGVNLLDVGHRIADGAVRFTGLREEVTTAIKALRDDANAEPLAKLSPTSLIFGFWDSRPETTMYKFGRMLSSTIRATNVAVVKRSAQFNPTFDPTLLGFDPDASEEDTEGTEKSGKSNDKDPLSQLGLRSAPATNTHGGVRVFGQIIRRTQINLVRLRALAVTKNGVIHEEDTLKLRRYILGLAFVAARVQTNYDLREGCLLRCTQSQAHLVYSTDNNKPFDWNQAHLYGYAKQVAEEFGVGTPKQVDFDVEKMKEAASKKKTDAKKSSKKAT